MVRVHPAVPKASVREPQIWRDYRKRPWGGSVTATARTVSMTADRRSPGEVVCLVVQAHGGLLSSEQTNC